MNESITTVPVFHSNVRLQSETQSSREQFWFVTGIILGAVATATSFLVGLLLTAI